MSVIECQQNIKSLMIEYCQTNRKKSESSSVAHGQAFEIVLLLERMLALPEFFANQSELCGWFKMLRHWRTICILNDMREETL